MGPAAFALSSAIGKFQAVFVNEGLEQREAVRLMVLERGMQSDDRHVVRLERLVDAPRLRDGDRDRMGTQRLKGDQRDHASSQRGQAERTIRVEPESAPRVQVPREPLPSSSSLGVARCDDRVDARFEWSQV